MTTVTQAPITQKILAVIRIVPRIGFDRERYVEHVGAHDGYLSTFLSQVDSLMVDSRGITFNGAWVGDGEHGFAVETSVTFSADASPDVAKALQARNEIPLEDEPGHDPKAEKEAAELLERAVEAYLASEIVGVFRIICVDAYSTF